MDEREVRRVVLGSFADWGDADRYAGWYSDDSDYVAFDGSHHRGRAANAALHRPLFGGVLYGTRILGDVESVRFVSPDVAIVHASGGVVWPWHGAVPAKRRSRQTLVVKNDGARWQIAAFHNTRLRPVGLPPGWVSAMLRGWTRLRMWLRHPR